MENDVIGGVGKHRFLIIKNNNLITPVENVGFESGIGDWGYSGAGVISRVFDSDTQFGNYCLKIIDNNAGAEEYAQYDLDIVGNMANRAFVLYFWAKGNSSTTNGSICIVSNSMIYNNSIVFKNLSLTEYWKPYYVIIQVPNSWDGTKLYLRFKPHYEGAGVAAVGTMYIDNINLYELSRDIEFDVATKLSQEWLRVVGSEYELSNGSLKEYVDGFRFKCSIFWDHLTADFESKRSKVMSALLLFFIPHIDYNWGILVKPDGGIKREYFHDKYVCHVGGIDMLGIELLNNDSCLLVEDSFIGDEEFLFYNYEDDIDPIL